MGFSVFKLGQFQANQDEPVTPQVAETELKSVATSNNMSFTMVFGYIFFFLFLCFAQRFNRNRSKLGGDFRGFRSLQCVLT